MASTPTTSKDIDIAGLLSKHSSEWSQTDVSSARRLVNRMSGEEELIPLENSLRNLYDEKNESTRRIDELGRELSLHAGKDPERTSRILCQLANCIEERKGVQARKARREDELVQARLAVRIREALTGMLDEVAGTSGGGERLKRKRSASCSVGSGGDEKRVHIGRRKSDAGGSPGG